MAGVLHALRPAASDHSHDAIQNRDQKEGGYETQNENVHCGHTGSVHRSDEPYHQGKTNYT